MTKYYRHMRFGRRHFPWKATLAVALTVMVLAWFGLSWLDSPGQPGHSFFEIKQDENVSQIISRLKDEGFIHSRWLFRQELKASGLADRLQPGLHDLSGVGDYRELIKRLTVSGVAANEFVLKVIEGWDLEDIKKELAEQEYAQADSFYQAAGRPRVGFPDNGESVPDWQAEYDFLASLPPGDSLEGYLFPDTYRLYRDSEPEEIVRRLLDNFERRLTAAGLIRRLKGSERDIHEVIILASILEKEVNGQKDRRLVADLFWRRLEAGMALQADSTINYVTGKSVPAVSAEDLETDSPYNTYRNKGLPPGPISNPGLQAIEAALDPLANDYWYFLTDEEGTVHYARDFEQHKRNKALYLW